MLGSMIACMAFLSFIYAFQAVGCVNSYLLNK